MAQTALAQIGRTYLVQASFNGKTYFVECDDLPFGKDQSEADAIALLEQHEDAEAIFEASEECNYFRNVSRQIAEAWLNKLAETFDPASDTWPKFIQRHVSPSVLQDIEAEIEADLRGHANHIRQERNANV